MASWTSRADLGKGATPSEGPGWGQEEPAEVNPRVDESKTEGLPIPSLRETQALEPQPRIPQRSVHSSPGIPGSSPTLTCFLLLSSRSLARTGLVLSRCLVLAGLLALAGPGILLQLLLLGRLALCNLLQEPLATGLPGLGRQDALLLEALLLLALEGCQSLRSNLGCNLRVQVCPPLGSQGA